MIQQKLLTYAPCLMLLLVGLLLVALFHDQPGLTVNLSGFGLGTGTAEAGGENISVGWFAVLAALVMYIITWWTERRAPDPDPDRLNARGMGVDTTAIEAFQSKMKRATIYSLIAFSILAILLFLGLLL